jgi:hypothetical protein
VAANFLVFHDFKLSATTRRTSWRGYAPR